MQTTFPKEIKMQLPPKSIMFDPLAAGGKDINVSLNKAIWVESETVMTLAAQGTDLVETASRKTGERAFPVRGHRQSLSIDGIVLT